MTVSSVGCETRVPENIDLTFSKALETAVKHAQQLKGSGQAGTVHNVASRSPRKEACYRCGRTNHKARDCKFKEAICHNCRKRGSRGGASNHKEETKEEMGRGDKRGNGWRKERTKWVDTEQGQP